MGLFKKRNKQGDNLKDEATRALSYEKRRLNKELENARQEAEIAKLRQKGEIEALRLQREQLKLQNEIAELSGEFDEEEPNSEAEMQNMLLMKLAGNFMQSPQHAGGFSGYNQQAVTEPEYQGVDLSDENINLVLEQIPKKYAKIGKKMSDEQLGELIKTRLGPYATEASISRIIKRFREKFK